MGGWGGVGGRGGGGGATLVAALVRRGRETKVEAVERGRASSRTTSSGARTSGHASTGARSPRPPRIVLSYRGTLTAPRASPPSPRTPLTSRSARNVSTPNPTSCDPAFPRNRNSAFVGFAAASASCSAPVRYTSSMDSDAARVPRRSKSFTSVETTVVFPHPCGALRPTTSGGGGSRERCGVWYASTCARIRASVHRYTGR